ncbi:ATP-binding cassette sub-family C member 4-like [Macrobrachium nipponense]|uniref:ATP-binding cassette sub-family C member 4-like n=1 Tax=Macrobrachium nipponense TaxID=159736 RepID=UPI0030C8B5FB
MDQTKRDRLPNPRDTAGSISKMVFWWVIPLMRLGYSRPLNAEDLYRVQKHDASQLLGDKLQKCWDDEVLKSKVKGRKASYVNALARCFGWEYGRVGLLAAFEECVLRIGQPLCLGGLIRYFNGEKGYTELHGWLYCTGVVMGSLLYIFSHHPFFFGTQHSGMQIRVASCSMIYRKALRLSKAALGKTTVGQMVNLLSNDVNRFDTSIIFLHYLWIGPLQTLIVLGILWNEIGPSCLAGIMLLILFVPLQSNFSNCLLSSALLLLSFIIKMYTWEKPFTALIEKARKSEIDVVMKTNYYRAVNMSLFFTSSKVIVFLALLTYVLTGNILTAEKVFVTSSLINNVRLVMTLFFPFGIAMGSETLISCQRLQDFLEMEELEETNRVQKSNLRPKLKDCGVTVSGLTAKWSEATEENTLTNVTCSVKAGELLAVIGPVGSGKGSLLHAILGELPAKAGSISVRGRVAYASQEPWVFSGTVKQNILFGQSFNEKRYNEVIRVCALEQDLEQLAEGDLTMVGERGVALSGGQKARVNLARAVYYDADIYLLDDPLSAVDTHVGRHLFDQCIMDHLKHKVRILVTHQLQYLKPASQILVLREGHTEAIGNYNQLVNSGIDFASLLSTGHDEETSSPSKQASTRTEKKNGIVSSLQESDKFDSSVSLHRRVRTLSNSINNTLSGSTSSLHDSLTTENIITISGVHLSDSNGSLNDNCQETPSKNANKLSDTDDNANNEQPEREQPDSEVRSKGSVKGEVYVKYCRAGGSWCLIIILFILNVTTQVLFSGTDYWLSYWTNGEQKRGQLVIKGNETELHFSGNDSTFSYEDAPIPKGYLDTMTNVYVYTGMIAGLFFLSLGRTILFFVMCMTASRTLHNRMFKSVIRVPIKFFDTHPVELSLNPFGARYRTGHTEAIGNYNQLVNSGIDFASLLSTGHDEETSSPSKQASTRTEKKNGIVSSLRKVINVLLCQSIIYHIKILIYHLIFVYYVFAVDSSVSLHRRVRTLSNSINNTLSGSTSSLHDSLTTENIITISGVHLSDSNGSLNDNCRRLHRKMQIRLLSDTDDNANNEQPEREQPDSEVRSKGSVKGEVYVKYCRAGGSWCLIIILFILNVTTQVLFSGTDYWLSYWTNGEQKRGQLVIKGNETELHFSGNDSTFSYEDAPIPKGYLDTMTNVYVYTGMIAGLFFLSLGRTILFFVMCMTSSRTLHNRMFKSVIRVPIKFFDTHPVGQILNRFTKDLGQVDEMLPITIFDVVTILLNFLGIIVVIASINIWVIVPTVVLGVIFIFLRRFYLCTARDVKRLEGITRSPVFSHLSASLQGLTTIRAFEAQQIFNDDFDKHQDLHSSAWFLFLCTTRWFGICLDWISCIYIGIVTFSFMGTKGTLGGDIGLAISSAMMLSGMFQWGVRQSAEVENQMTSVERVLEYSKLEPEAPLETDESKKPRDTWPENGKIVFDDVSLQYVEDNPPVLKNLNFCIKGKEKIGIVGRTGAGKSSMITSLFRLTEPSGIIFIDDINVQELGLHDVRGNISIIPQDPTLFSGTMRRNLDPFDQFSDEKLWKSLEEVQLKDAISDLQGGLEANMSEGGMNLSVGQRQLVCLARAILRHNKILVLDEATANVDPRTDALIQQTIRTKFEDCTVLTIAHRLHTIMDSDRVMVLEAGRIEEFDEPHILLKNVTSRFSTLVQQTGRSATEQLREIAKRAYLARHPSVSDLQNKESETNDHDEPDNKRTCVTETSTPEETNITGETGAKESTKL